MKLCILFLIKRGQFFLEKGVNRKLESTLEGIMGQAKEYHGMGKAKFRGLNKVEIQLLLTATAINLKKMVKILYVEDVKSRLSSEISGITKAIRSIFRNLIREIVIQVP